MTATRGCKAEEGAGPTSWLLLGVWEVEAGEGGTTLEGTDEGATALSRKPAAEVGAEGKRKKGGEEREAVGGGGVVEGVVR